MKREIRNAVVLAIVITVAVAFASVASAQCPTCRQQLLMPPVIYVPRQAIQMVPVQVPGYQVYQARPRLAGRVLFGPWRSYWVPAPIQPQVK